MSTVIKPTIIKEKTRKITEFECLAIHITHLDTNAWLISCFQDWNDCHDHGTKLIHREIVDSFRFEFDGVINIWSDHEIDLKKTPRTVYSGEKYLFETELIEHYPTNTRRIVFIKGNPAPEV